jgi:hypothetical protein
MRKFFCLFFFLVLGFQVHAQTTSVSGTVKDGSGIAYANATLKAQLVFTGGIPVSGQPTVTVSNAAQCAAGGWGSSPCQVPFQGTASGSLSSTGSFSGLALQDNTLVTPAATQWLFTFSEIGTPPPVGTGPQTCSGQLTISGASQSISASFSACPGLSNAGALPAGLSFVSPTLTVSTAGSGNGSICLSGNTSGVACMTAPAVAGSSFNDLAFTNNLAPPSASAGNPSYNFSGSNTSGMYFNGTGPALVAFGQVSCTFNSTSVPFATCNSYGTASNCNVNSASPAACGAAPSGTVVVPTTTTTYTVNTTAVTANSRILILPITDASGLSGAPTCNAPPTPFIGYESGRTAATSFTFTLPSTTGTSCWTYWIVN